MKQLFTLCAVLFFSVSAFGQQAKPSLQEVVDAAAKTTLEHFADKKLEASQLSITLIDLRDQQHPVVQLVNRHAADADFADIEFFHVVPPVLKESKSVHFYHRGDNHG